MGQTIGPVVSKPGIAIDPQDWAMQPAYKILEAIIWRQDEIIKLTETLDAKRGSYQEALTKQRLQREVLVLRNLMPSLKLAEVTS